VRSADGGGRGAAGGDMAARVPSALLSRRTLLRAGALIAVAGPLAAACTATPAPPPPDVLQPMLNAATTDAGTAKAAAAAFADNGATLAVIASVRQSQASALRAEVKRAAGEPAPAATAPPSTTPPAKPADESAVTSHLLTALTTAQQQAAALLPKLPRYRCGLVGSVAAGCASLTEALHSTPITMSTARSANPAPSGGSATLSEAPVPSGGSALPSGSAATPLAADTTTALQQALSAEHAALWLYGTASAFVNGSYETELVAAMDAVQNLRDATEQRLMAGGATPQPAQPAYLVPKPVTSQSSAMAALAIAESDATVAWRSVLEHTDDATLRGAALAALIDSAVRQTRWRRVSRQSPASIAMPGQAA
jgi:hypothetical protein